MKKLLIIALACLFSVTLTYAQTAKKSASASSWTGYVVDKMCKTDVPYTKGKGHTKECLLAEDCISTGFGLATADGKWTAFDKKGSDMAANLIKTSKKTKDFLVVVSGKMKGSTIEVTSIKDKM
jgi:hypothetical protein